MRREVNLMNRGSGDCWVAGPEYQLRLETTSEAQKIATIFYKEFDLVRKPRVRISNYTTRNLNGTANHHTGEIHLRNVGANVGVLIHELAHLDKKAARVCDSTSGLTTSRYGRLRRRKRVVHGNDFKDAQTRMLIYWRKHVEKTFTITGSESKHKEELNKERNIDRKKSIEFARKETRYFGIGDKVWFISRHSMKITGKITKLNRKTVNILSTEGGKWRCSRGHLNLVETKEVDPIPMPTYKTKIHIDKPEPVIEDTNEEIEAMIQGAMDSLSKYAVHDSLSITGIVRCFHANGVKNTNENRKIAVDYVKEELGLTIR